MINIETVKMIVKIWETYNICTKPSLILEINSPRSAVSLSISQTYLDIFKQIKYNTLSVRQSNREEFLAAYNYITKGILYDC